MSDAPPKSVDIYSLRLRLFNPFVHKIVQRPLKRCCASLRERLRGRAHGSPLVRPGRLPEVACALHVGSEATRLDERPGFRAAAGCSGVPNGFTHGAVEARLRLSDVTQFCRQVVNSSRAHLGRQQAALAGCAPIFVGFLDLIFHSGVPGLLSGGETMEFLVLVATRSLGTGSRGEHTSSSIFVGPRQIGIDVVPRAVDDRGVARLGRCLARRPSPDDADDVACTLLALRQTKDQRLLYLGVLAIDLLTLQTGPVQVSCNVCGVVQWILQVLDRRFHCTAKTSQENFLRSLIILVVFRTQPTIVVQYIRVAASSITLVIESGGISRGTGRCFGLNHTIITIKVNACVTHPILKRTRQSTIRSDYLVISTTAVSVIVHVFRVECSLH